jgi:hypothetical protein
VTLGRESTAGRPFSWPAVARSQQLLQHFCQGHMLSASPEHFDRRCTRKERGQLHRRRLLARRAAEFVTDDGVGLPPVEPAHGPPDARASPNIQPIIPQTAASPGSASQPPTGRQCEFKGVSGDAHLSKNARRERVCGIPGNPGKTPILLESATELF